jgi:ATP-dependent helicase/nuclease subunit A
MYKDIVVLLRSLSGWDDVFRQVLESQGIPTYTESKSGYLDAPEVAILLDFLSVIDNPTQDIPLVAVMRSSLGGFSDEELALLRIAINNNPELSDADSFYEGITGDIDIPDELAGRLWQFTSMIEEYRQMSVYTPVHEVLEDLLDRTGYEAIVTAMPAGNQRRANVELLLGKAADFERTSFKGLFHFVRYIEHIKVVQADYGEAGTIDENADVVRIMSIHKSKGLEFPVVFVCGLSKEFNRMDTKGDMIVDMDLGIGVKCINTDLRVKYDTIKRKIIARKMELDSLGEEIRILYVALTRAKEKLILIAHVKDMAKALDGVIKKMPTVKEDGQLLPLDLRESASSYLSLVLPAVISHSSMERWLQKYALNSTLETGPSLKVSIIGDSDLKNGLLKEAVRTQISLTELENKDIYDEQLLEKLKTRLFAKYSHEDLKGLFTKTTVSELKKKVLIEENEFGAKHEAFEVEKEQEKESKTRGGELTGADRGTAYHRVMELIDEEALKELSAETLSAWIRKNTDAHILPVEYAQVVNPADIMQYFKTDLGNRMAAALSRGQLFREKPFMMGVSAKELDPGFPEEEMVLVQGIVDAWFIEDGEIVLLDYKTDKVRDEKTLTGRYAIQLQLYKRALEAATKKKVKETYIYSFTLGCQIKL